MFKTQTTKNNNQIKYKTIFDSALKVLRYLKQLGQEKIKNSLPWKFRTRARL